MRLAAKEFYRSLPLFPLSVLWLRLAQSSGGRRNGQNPSSFGDGVNVAARLEGLAEPGGICVSPRVQEDAAGRLDLTFDDLGELSLKNIARLMRVYRLRLAEAENTLKSAPVDGTPVLLLPDKPSIAVLRLPI
jgi:hypothetical protein